MRRGNVIIGSILVLLSFSCSTTRMVTLENELSTRKKGECSVSNIKIEAPKIGHNVFTFEDIHTFSLPGMSSRAGGITTYTPGDVITVNRANFEYHLSENSDSNFYDALSTMFTIEQTSPYSITCKADIKYYLPKRENLHNTIGIYMLLNVMIIEDSSNVFENSYEAAEEEIYFTGWVTIPRNSLMNDLFNKALNRIMDQMISDNGIEDAFRFQTQE